MSLTVAATDQIVAGMFVADNPSDLLFWPLVIFALTAAIFVVGFVVTVMVLTRRSPGHHPQVTGHQGTNHYDASSHTTIKVRDVNIGRPSRQVPNE